MRARENDEIRFCINACQSTQETEYGKAPRYFNVKIILIFHDFGEYPYMCV